MRRQKGHPAPPESDEEPEGEDLLEWDEDTVGEGRVEVAKKDLLWWDEDLLEWVEIAKKEEGSASSSAKKEWGPLPVPLVGRATSYLKGVERKRDPMEVAYEKYLKDLEVGRNKAYPLTWSQEWSRSEEWEKFQSSGPLARPVSPVPRDYRSPLARRTYKKEVKQEPPVKRRRALVS